MIVPTLRYDGVTKNPRPVHTSQTLTKDPLPGAEASQPKWWLMDRRQKLRKRFTPIKMTWASMSTNNFCQDLIDGNHLFPSQLGGPYVFWRVPWAVHQVFT